MKVSELLFMISIKRNILEIFQRASCSCEVHVAYGVSLDGLLGSAQCIGDARLWYGA